MRSAAQAPTCVKPPRLPVSMRSSSYVRASYTPRAPVYVPAAKRSPAGLKAMQDTMPAGLCISSASEVPSVVHAHSYMLGCTVRFSVLILGQAAALVRPFLLAQGQALHDTLFPMTTA